MKNLPTTAAEIAAMDKTELANACLDAIAENARLREALRDVLPHAWAAEYHDEWIRNGVRREACQSAEAALAGEVKP